jgi:Zn-dependent alcohol dehydrogenase
MRALAAVLCGADEPFAVEEVELVGPGPGEVLVRVSGETVKPVLLPGGQA